MFIQTTPSLHTMVTSSFPKRITRRVWRGAWVIIGASLAATAAAAEKKAPVSEPSPAPLEQRVANLETLMQKQGLLELLQQLQSLQNEIAKLRGRVEVNGNEIEKLQERQGNIYSDLDQRLRKLEGSPEAAALPADTSPPLEVLTPAETAPPSGAAADSGLTVEIVTQPPPEEPAAEGAIPADVPPAATSNPVAAQAEYQAAFNLLKQAQYDQASAAFNNFLLHHPDSQYAENAQYWTGEAYFVTRRYNEAITEYMKLLTSYPQGAKAANSLLKIGISYAELQQKEEARKVLQDVIRQYPGTTAAQDAEKRLQQLGAE